MEAEATIIFVIAAFGLAVVLILSKDKVPPRIKRTLAMITIFFVLFAFFLIVYSFFRAGA
jgi:hypothetical protein